MATVPKPLRAPASLDDLIPRDGILASDELEQLAREIAERPELWEHLVQVDPERRRYELIHEDESVDAWVLSCRVPRPLHLVRARSAACERT